VKEGSEIMLVARTSKHWRSALCS